MNAALMTDVWRWGKKQAGLYVIAAAMLVSAPVFAERNVPFSDDEQGPTCAYYNFFSKLSWPGLAGMYAGEGATTSARKSLIEAIGFNSSSQLASVSADVSDFVRESADKDAGEVSLVLLSASGSGVLELHSRESDSSKLRPRLRLFFKDGREVSLEPRADTYLVCNSHMPQGADRRILVSPDFRALLSFPLPTLTPDFERAELQLAVSKVYGHGSFRVGRLYGFSDAMPARSEQGLSAAYKHDVGLERDPDVLFVERFERNTWDARWTYRSTSSHLAKTVREDSDLRFSPIDGAALRVEIPADGHTGLDLRYGFKDKLDYEPEEIYLRYYLRFANDWHPVVEGGKLPGFAGTYGRGGWGQRRANGTNGWSARGLFTSHPPTSNATTTPTGIGSYVYHVGMASQYSGDPWPWGHLNAMLLNNRWYAVEQHLRLNKPGRSDGYLKAWVDGVEVFEKKGIDFRHSPDLRIEQVWMNVYHGGSRTPGKDLHLYIDNVVIAKRYIGPMNSPKASP